MCVVAALIDSLCPINVVIILVIKGTNPLKTRLMSSGGEGGMNFVNLISVGLLYEFCHSISNLWDKIIILIFSFDPFCLWTRDVLSGLN